MSSQLSQSGKSVEVIDLTNETTKHNATITIDDSVVVLEASEDEDVLSNIYNSLTQYSPAPVSIDDFSDIEPDNPNSSNSSTIRQRLPSPPLSNLSLSPLKSPLPSRSFSPFLDTRAPLKSTPKINKSKTKASNKESREEAKKLKLKQKEEERLQREADRANAANKAYDNCTARIDTNIPTLINDPDESSFKTFFDESMVKYHLSDLVKIKNSITWSYKRTEIVDGTCVVKFKDSSWIAIVMQGCEYFKKILAFKESSDSPTSIKSYLNYVRQQTQSNVILLVYNLSNYLKTERAKEAKNYRKTFKDKFEGNQVELCDIEEGTPSVSTIGITELQDLRILLEMDFKRQHKHWKLHIEFYEKTVDLVQSIVRYTLSVAKLEAKVKAQASTGLDWAINMDKEKAVDPTKSIEDLKKLWITQLQQFSQVTLPIAKAIAAEYPSPCVLLAHYQELTTIEAENLLAELHVQRNLRRQIGSNISKRIHCFITCEDPNVHIGLS